MTDAPICPFVNRGGHSPLDPSANVADLVEGATKRLDDLRDVEHKANQRAHKSARHEVNTQAKTLRREMKLRARYEAKLSLAESQRLDSIRNVDVAASAADRLVQETRATTLATAQNASAEALRGQVATTAAAQTIALDNKIAPVQKDVSDLRETQFKQQGERAQAIESRVDSRDAAAEMKPIIDALEKLTLAQALAAGGKAQNVESRARSGNVGLWVGVGVAAISAVVAFSSMLLAAAAIIVTVLLTK
ncbi:MAG TPA: hypothetical protein VIM47_00960 [Dermatophilaceae bacterium]